jgi:hypothetical protein
VDFGLSQSGEHVLDDQSPLFAVLGGVEAFRERFRFGHRFNHQCKTMPVPAAMTRTIM